MARWAQGGTPCREGNTAPWARRAQGHVGTPPSPLSATVVRYFRTTAPPPMPPMHTSRASVPSVPSTPPPPVLVVLAQQRY